MLAAVGVGAVADGAAVLKEAAPFGRLRQATTPMPARKAANVQIKIRRLANSYGFSDAA